MDSTALAVTTDSRALGVLDAENRTAAAVDMLVASGIERLYVKIDSTMRGSIPGQMSGALKAWRSRFPDALAIVCAAYPRMRRTVVNNHLLVSGRPVEQSAAGSDPVTPVNTSDLALLIPGSRHVAIDELATHRGADVLTIDAQSNEDLHELALAIDKIGPRAIPVGSAGLADALADVWGGSPATGIMPGFARAAARHILVQVTSMNPVSRNQVARLHEAFPEIELLAGRAEDVSVDVAQRIETGRWQLLGLIGGDGARAALGRLNASAIRIVGAHVEGIPMGTIVGGRADGMPLFTKAGGFGDEDALVRLVEALTS
jgi:uncharacterized protein YgbK (DUF1537 family)